LIPNTSGILRGLLLLAVPCLAALSMAGGPASSPAVEPQAQAGAQGGAAVGQAVCTGCHQPYAALVNRTPHGAPGIGGGCEGCHGGGGAHARAMVTATTPAAREAGRALIFSFDRAPTENAGQCLGCHEANRETQAFDHSEHQLNGVACQNCHSPHLTGADRAEQDRWLGERLLRASQPGLCFGCHTTIAGQFSLPTHHPVEEGLVACTNCHNPRPRRAVRRSRGTEARPCSARTGGS
jgi:hypothetical protein